MGKRDERVESRKLSGVTPVKAIKLPARMGLLALAAVTAGSLLAAGAPMADASTMPRADFTRGSRVLGVGAGNGIGASVDVAVQPNLSLGGAIASGVYGFDSTRWDVRMLYQFVNGGRRNLSVAGLLGVWGDSRYQRPLGLAPGIEIGFALSFPFTRELTGRLNLAVPYYGTLGGPYFNAFGGPSAGAELGYRFQPHIEGTLGVNGMGGLLGAKLNF